MMGSFLWLNHFSNSLHITTSAYDPSAVPHSTVRLTNPNLRSQKCWYVLHWRPEEGSKIFNLPDNEESHKKRKMRCQNKTQGQRGPSKDARSSRRYWENQSTQSHAAGTDAPSQGAAQIRGAAFHQEGSASSWGTD